MVWLNSTYSTEKNGRIRVFIDFVKLIMTQSTPYMTVLLLLGGKINMFFKKIVIFGRARQAVSNRQSLSCLASQPLWMGRPTVDLAAGR